MFYDAFYVIALPVRFCPGRIVLFEVGRIVHNIVVCYSIIANQSLEITNF